jgi:cell division transport system ATP-binding protein
VVVATHDKSMVDRMRRRVIELSGGRIVRDEQAGRYSPDESTSDLGQRLRAARLHPDEDEDER